MLDVESLTAESIQFELPFVLYCHLYDSCVEPFDGKLDTPTVNFDELFFVPVIDALIVAFAFVTVADVAVDVPMIYGLVAVVTTTRT